MANTIAQKADSKGRRTICMASSLTATVDHFVSVERFIIVEGTCRPVGAGVADRVRLIQLGPARHRVSADEQRAGVARSAVRPALRRESY